MAKLLHRGRSTARQLFRQTPYPTAKDRLWRHLELGDYTDAEKKLLLPVYLLTNQDPKPVDLSMINQATEARWQQKPAPAHRLELLHHAYWQSGVRLIIPAGVCFTAPIQLVVSCAGSGSLLPRIVIETGENSQSTILIRFALPRRCELTVSGEVEVYAGPSSICNVINEIPVAAPHHQFNRVNLTVEQNARVFHQVVCYGAGLCRTEVRTELAGKGACAQLSGLAVGGDKAQIVFQTEQLHLHGDTESNLHYRAIASEEARVLYRGLIRIDKGAEGCNAYQKNANLLLSAKSRAYTTPELEIKANEVRCTHAASTGPLDQSQLFYLQSRGLGSSEAQSLLVRAFASAGVPVEDIQARKIVNSIITRAVHNVAK